MVLPRAMRCMKSLPDCRPSLTAPAPHPTAAFNPGRDRHSRQRGVRAAQGRRSCGYASARELSLFRRPLPATTRVAGHRPFEGTRPARAGRTRALIPQWVSRGAEGDFYNQRFGVGFSQSEQADPVAFRRTLWELALASCMTAPSAIAPPEGNSAFRTRLASCETGHPS